MHRYLPTNGICRTDPEIGFEHKYVQPPRYRQVPSAAVDVKDVVEDATTPITLPSSERAILGIRDICPIIIDLRQSGLNLETCNDTG